MKVLLTVGILLIVLGVTGLVYGGITYTKDKDTVDVGIAEVEFSEKERLQIHPVIGGVVLVAGVVVMAVALSRRSS